MTGFKERFWSELFCELKQKWILHLKNKKQVEKKSLRCFLVKIAKFLRTPIFNNIYENDCFPCFFCQIWEINFYFQWIIFMFIIYIIVIWLLKDLSTFYPANIRLDEEVLKTSWRRLSCSCSEDVLKTSSSRRIYSPYSYVFRRRLKDVLIKTNILVLVIRLQDVLQKCLQDIFKTSSRRFQNVFRGLFFYKFDKYLLYNLT